MLEELRLSLHTQFHRCSAVLYRFEKCWVIGASLFLLGDAVRKGSLWNPANLCGLINNNKRNLGTPLLLQRHL